MMCRFLLLVFSLAASGCATHSPAPCHGPYEPVNTVTAEVSHV
jgi:hypothetical protein